VAAEHPRKKNARNSCLSAGFAGRRYRRRSDNRPEVVSAYDRQNRRGARRLWHLRVPEYRRSPVARHGLLPPRQYQNLVDRIPVPTAISSSTTLPTYAIASAGDICPSSAWIPRSANSLATSRTLAPAGVTARAWFTTTTSVPTPTGVAIPYGIYDTVANRGSVIVGVSHNTPAFAARAIAHWWRREGQGDYSSSRQLLILADTGGSNGYRCRAWKTELQSQLADRFHLNVTVGHYPTGTSKWNPIEHRLFSEISKNWAGEPLDSYQKILNFIRATSTRTGLAVSAYLDRRHYPIGAEPTPDELQRLRLEPHDILPKWNYTITPNRA
jgi:Rhodopirellula transposase DDE domain